MSISSLLLNQIVIMFVFMGIGYVFYKIKFISDQGSKDLGKILLYLVIPVVVISNFMVENSAENINDLVSSSIISLLCMGVAMMVSYIFFKEDGIANFRSSFSNAGFIGIPLVSAVVGSHASFYISAMIVLINILQWTYGVYMISKDKSTMQPKKVITNPLVISVCIGLILFVTQIKVPQTLTTVFSLVKGLNTPLAMMVSGVYLAQCDLVPMLKKMKCYVVSGVRLLVIPLITIALFKMLPWGSKDVILSILIAAACPVGSNVAIFARNYEGDYRSAVEYVCMSTILCLLTLPLIVRVAEMIL